MGEPIYSAAGEACVLANIRQDWRNLHTHPWVEYGKRKVNLRRMIRDAVKRVRAYREERERTPDSVIFGRGVRPQMVVCAWCRTVLREGVEPVSHGICHWCKETHFPAPGEAQNAGGGK